MSEAQEVKIDAHVQFNGIGWQTYLELQPGLKCEFDDHRTCLEASAKLQELEDGKCLEVKEIEAARLSRKVDEAAKAAAEQAEWEKVSKAGQAKSQAARAVALAWDAEQKEIEAEAGAEIARISGAAESSIAAVKVNAERDAAASNEKRAKAEAEIAATDWLKAAEGVEAGARG